MVARRVALFWLNATRDQLSRGLLPARLSEQAEFLVISELSEDTFAYATVGRRVLADH